MNLDTIHAFLGGRSGRGEYWLWILDLYALNVALTLTLGTALGLPISATMMAFANVTVALGMTIVLGSIPGHTEKNRFGVQAAKRA